MPLDAKHISRPLPDQHTSDVLRTWLLAWSCILALNVADFSFAESVFLVITIRENSANNEGLILGPVWKGNQRRVPDDSGRGISDGQWLL